MFNLSNKWVRRNCRQVFLAQHCWFTAFVFFDELGKKEKNEQKPFDKTKRIVILICVRFRLFIRMLCSSNGEILSIIVKRWFKLMKSSSDAYLLFCFSCKLLAIVHIPKIWLNIPIQWLWCDVVSTVNEQFLFWIPFKGSTEQMMRIKVWSLLHAHFVPINVIFFSEQWTKHLLYPPQFNSFGLLVVSKFKVSHNQLTENRFDNFVCFLNNVEIGWKVVNI